MTDTGNDESPELVRTQDFSTDGPVELDLSNNIGPIQIELTDTEVTHVEVRHDATSGFHDWRGGLAGLLTWVTEQLSDAGIRPGAGDKDAIKEPVSEAVRQTRIDMTGSRLVVRSPSTMPLRTVPLAITIQAPGDSQVSIQTGSGSVSVTGSAGRVQIQSGAGA